MSASHSRVLVVGVDAETFAKLQPMLDRASVEVDRFPRARASLELVTAVRFDLLIVRSPLEDMSLGEYLASVRVPESKSRRSSLLLLVSDGDTMAAQAFLGRGANRSIALSESEEHLQQAVSDLLHVAPRIGARIFASLQVQVAEDQSLTMCQTENVSATGMLIRTNVNYPVGTMLDFEFNLPTGGEVVRGSAEVVRHTVVGREAVAGVGVRFASFNPGSEDRFRQYLESQTPSD
ncbi:MAG: PilZ domain-containing protein [Acidobacteriota bacterium]|nr:PilZ domain-containing protein [Acidobacteriota bacterium]